MAETVVDADMLGGLEESNNVWGPYYINTTTGVIVSIDSANDPTYWRTADGGATWAQNQIKATTAEAIAVWWDQETPGDTGDLIHITWLQQADDDCEYISLNISTDTLGTER